MVPFIFGKDSLNKTECMVLVGGCPFITINLKDILETGIRAITMDMELKSQRVVNFTKACFKWVSHQKLCQSLKRK